MKYFEFARSVLGYSFLAILVFAAFTTLHFVNYQGSVWSLCNSMYWCATYYSAISADNRVVYPNLHHIQG